MARPLWLELASALYHATSHHTAMGERIFTSALNHTITTIADYFNVNYAMISNGLKGMKTRFRYVVMQDLTPYSTLLERFPYLSCRLDLHFLAAMLDFLRAALKSASTDSTSTPCATSSLSKVLLAFFKAAMSASTCPCVGMK